MTRRIHAVVTGCLILCASCGAISAASPLPGVCSLSPVRSAEILLSEAGLPNMQVVFPARDLHRQASVSSTTVCFEQAMMLAVASLAMEERTDTGPISAARRLVGHRVCVRHEEAEMVACYMNRRTSRMGLAGEQRPPPLEGAVDSAWVFWLELPDLTDLTFWAAVERAPPHGIPPRVVSFGVTPNVNTERAENETTGPL